jgi:hypothetical protein
MRCIASGHVARSAGVVWFKARSVKQYLASLDLRARSETAAAYCFNGSATNTGICRVVFFR